MAKIDLLFIHKYREAVKQFEHSLVKRPNDLGIMAGHAKALLCVGERLEQALSEFQHVNEQSRLEGERMRLKTQPYLEWIGATLWLLGRRDEAKGVFYCGATSVLNGTIKYGDSAGGLSHGLLLWYAAVTLCDADACSFAMKFFAELSDQWVRCLRDEPWAFPGPIAQMILGRQAPAEILQQLCDAENPTEAASRALELSKEDKGILDSTVQALFYLAVKKRAESNESGCKIDMMTCANIANPITAPEWFLARAEAGFNPESAGWPWRPSAVKRSRR